MKIENNKLKKKRFDLLILIPTILISVIGIITLLSTTIGSDGTFQDLSIVNKQIIYLIIGFILFFFVSRIDISITRYWQVALSIYVITVLLLVAVLIFGPEINNVRRWLVIGGVQIQPSEIAKITVILTTASVLSYKDKYNEWLLFGISFLLALPLVILIYVEPGGSMSLLTLVIWFLVAFTGLSNQLRNTIALIIMTLITGTFLLISVTGSWLFALLLIPTAIISILSYYYRDSWRMFIIVSVIIGIIVGSFSTLVYEGIFQDYQKDRIEAFINPTENSEDIGFNVNQARIAIGSGQIFGKGFGNGTQSKRDFLPEHQTDFIFASYAEEFGLVGSLFLLVLYSIIIVKGLIASVDNVNNSFFAMILIGIIMKLLLEIFINIGTNTGTIPATGIPLPLVSAGGTITVMTLFSLGIIQSIMNRAKKSTNSNNIIDNY
ncbi:MAG: rod shape-determining protein, rod shape determining protein RodA [candidate division WS6 bacterium GW2011_GWC1_33_20]|uniref:Rod shape-determining protein RodA n=2 Tax=Candidatus Dojkabacteria TaxID=74243 RepID=A0A0G0AE88_9BACT|nr:MAG: rod shape-determining protein, rod shape determining protein RodA [candidate division WS6 bacterium GW2011_GWC1_33_20]KKP44494.1 MAG: rod shape-determining protein, rod shape determining protein RodA [candidate division WS6 bacterium GW2011_GWF1_33_233]KKP54239.1 MAG: rod shape-determining protein, rod shape determining protein RodA [candidate division WS6 bacterium GW2011_WS6_33_547]KKP54953.1 MAG: Rod shape-determining protein RodA [candidate division WS6 bacterium GW2011_GWB1_33_6]KK